MTDEELLAELDPQGSDLTLEHVAKLDTAKRESFVRMIEFGRDWNLHAAGVGEAPDMTGVIVCREHRQRAKRAANQQPPPLTNDLNPKGKES